MSENAPAEVATPLYEIQDGARRSKAAQLLGKTTIAARISIQGKLGPVIEVPIESLRSPKTIIETGGAGFSRWRKVYRATEAGTFPTGDPVPPIEIQLGQRGVPIQDVIVEGIGDE